MTGLRMRLGGREAQASMETPPIYTPRKSLNTARFLAELAKVILLRTGAGFCYSFESSSRQECLV